jgi:poly(U)-specific endoribonuclease
MDIYQEIWDADLSHAGIKAVAKGTKIEDGLSDRGYVIVNENYREGQHLKLLEKPVIPKFKQSSYERVKKLFDNFTLDETKPEITTKDETAEVQSFIENIYKTLPMQVARDYIQTRSHKKFSDDEWWSLIQQIWFGKFDMGENKSLSGFEHVILGEQKQATINGYHFWYKYYCDEHFQLIPTEPIRDLIIVLGGKGNTGDKSPDIATLSFEWLPFSYEAGQKIKLTKPIGVFWIGPSAEGLMAIGMVRFIREANAPSQAIINNVKYKLSIFKSYNCKHIRTFYPEFIGMVK